MVFNVTIKKKSSYIIFTLSLAPRPIFMPTFYDALIPTLSTINLILYFTQLILIFPGKLLIYYNSKTLFLSPFYIFFFSFKFLVISFYILNQISSFPFSCLCQPSFSFIL